MVNCCICGEPLRSRKKEIKKNGKKKYVHIKCNPTQKTMFVKAKFKKYADMVKLTSVDKAKESIKNLGKEMREAKTDEKKNRIIKVATLAANRCKAMLSKKTYVKPETKKRYREMEKLFREFVSKHKGKYVKRKTKSNPERFNVAYVRPLEKEGDIRDTQTDNLYTFKIKGMSDIEAFIEADSKFKNKFKKKTFHVKKSDIPKRKRFNVSMIFHELEKQLNSEKKKNPKGKLIVEAKGGSTTYFCSQCNKNHRLSSKIGKEHNKSSNPIPATVAIKYGPKAVKLAKEHGPKVIDYVQKYGKEGIDLLSKHGKKALTMVPNPTAGRTLSQILKSKGVSSWPQTILFDKEKWSEKRAKEWLKKKGYYYGAYEAPGKYHRFRQYDPKKGPKKRTRTKEFGKGVKGIFEFFGEVKKKSQRKKPTKKS